MRRARLVLLSLGLLVGLLPAADAGLTVTPLQFDPVDFLLPGGAGSKATTTATFQCSGSEFWGPTDASHPLTLGGLMLPPDFTLEGPSTTEVPASACAGPASQTWTKDLVFTLKADPKVPGLRTNVITLTFDLPASGSALAASATATGQVKTDFIGKVEAMLVNQTVATDHAQAHFVLRLRNLGNAATAVSVLGPDPPLKGIVVQLPGESTLGMPGSGSDTATVPVLLTISGAAASSTPVPLRLLVSASQDRTRHGPEVALTGTVLLGADGTAAPKSSPLPAPMLFAVATLGLAALARRRARA